MVEAAIGVRGGGQPRRLQQLERAARGQVGALGRVLQRVEGRIEAAEIVDGLGPQRQRGLRLARHPVRRHDQHRLRAG